MHGPAHRHLVVSHLFASPAESRSLCVLDKDPTPAPLLAASGRMREARLSFRGNPLAPFRRAGYFSPPELL